jgi:D-amino-acid dehydrogenase
MKINIIGAGIAGITAAYFLTKRGYQVTVHEQEDYPAMRTSYANGGQVSVSNSEVWTSWSNIFKGIKWLLKKDAPLLIRPSLDWDKAVWLSKFLYHTANNDSAKRTAETIRLGIESRKYYQEIIDNENLSFDQSNCGILHFYKDQKYFNNAKEIQDIYESNGCEWKLLTPDQILEIEPTLSGTSNILGGAWTPSDWTGDIHKFCHNLSTVLQEKYSVKFVFGKTIESLDVFSNELVVIANGVGSKKLAKTINEDIPVYPVKGYSITIETNTPDEYSNIPKTSLLDDQAKIVSSCLGNRLRIAGTAEFAGENYDISRSRIDPLLNWVKDNFPLVNRKNYSQWTCLRPMTPNMMPIVRQSLTKSNVFYHTGHGHLGWTLCPATANQLLNLLCK